MLRYLVNVVTLQLNAEACNGCGMCITVCPHGVFEINNRRAVIIDRDACIECGACVINCPVDAISVQTGAGCATAILLGAVGKSCDCSSSCGISPPGTDPAQANPSITETEKGCNTGKSSCCGQ